jgi:IS5 family transposase
MCHRRPICPGCLNRMSLVSSVHLIGKFTGARAFIGAPFDGHTLHEQIERVTILMQDTGIKPSTAVVDLGYCGVEGYNPGLTITHWGKAKRLSPESFKLVNRRSAIEPVIGHFKADHRMDRCYLKGEFGDKLHAVPCAAGYNVKWLLRAIGRKGLTGFLRLLTAQTAAAIAASIDEQGRNAGVIQSPPPIVVA